MKLNNSCLKLALAALMILLPGIAWGTGTTYDYAATLTVKSTGNGKVYASESPTLSDDIVWQSSESTKTLPNNGTTSTSWSPTLYAHAKAETGYKFSGWNNNENDKSNPKQVDFTLSSSTTTATQTFTASFSPISYTITYQLGGGTNNSSNPDTYTIETENITLGNPTRPGYTFTKWTLTSMEGDWTKPIGSEITTITKGHIGAITLTAVWTANDYEIKFEPNEGTFNGEIQNPLPYKTSDDTISLPEITREGFTFTGWTASFEPGDSDHGGWDTSTGKYGNGQTITIENKYYGNVTLTAGWEKEPDPSSIKVSITGLKGDDHAIFNISYDKQGQTAQQQIAIHEYAIVKIPGGVLSVTVEPSSWTKKTYEITPNEPQTQNISSDAPTLFTFTATPKQGQNIYETSREF